MRASGPTALVGFTLPRRGRARPRARRSWTRPASPPARSRARATRRQLGKVIGMAWVPAREPTDGARDRRSPTRAHLIDAHRADQPVLRSRGDRAALMSLAFLDAAEPATAARAVRAARWSDDGAWPRCAPLECATAGTSPCASRRRRAVAPSSRRLRRRLAPGARWRSRATTSAAGSARRSGRRRLAVPGHRPTASAGDLRAGRGPERRRLSGRPRR